MNSSMSHLGIIWGHTDSEEKAMTWRDCNPEYRKYRYCPDKDITPKI